MDEQLATFKKKGYIILKNLLSPPEVKRLKESIEAESPDYNQSDGHGTIIRMALWNDLSSTITGMIGRSERVVRIVEKLLECEVYHHHSKVSKKDAHTGGSFQWHQDYGYWYNLKCLYPTMGTMWISLDKADRSNGCLQIIEGSHLPGRMDHTKTGDQLMVDPERVEVLQKRLSTKYAETEPGDAIFFHSNVVHRSEPNTSDRRRWAFMVCYNSADNIPYGVHPCADYKPLITVPDSTIMTCPLTNAEVEATDKTKFWAGVEAAGYWDDL